MDALRRDDADFAEMARRLGLRVKRYRARRGMSRKVLSLQSGVSERYLAQLESGQANVSVHILWNLAHCMNTSVGALIEERDEDSPDLVLPNGCSTLLRPMTSRRPTSCCAIVSPRPAKAPDGSP